MITTIQLLFFKNNDRNDDKLQFNYYHSFLKIKKSPVISNGLLQHLGLAAIFLLSCWHYFDRQNTYKISTVREYLFIGQSKMISREILSHKDLTSVAFYNISRLLYEIRFMVSFFHGNQLKFI